MEPQGKSLVYRMSNESDGATLLGWGLVTSLLRVREKPSKCHTFGVTAEFWGMCKFTNTGSTISEDDCIAQEYPTKTRAFSFLFFQIDYDDLAHRTALTLTSIM